MSAQKNPRPTSTTNSHPSWKKIKNIIKTKNPLIVGILFLQAISLVTTIEGANIIFPEGELSFLFWTLKISSLLGFTVQFMFVMLVLFDEDEEFTSLRKNLAIGLLIFASIYSSYSSIYNQISGGILDKNMNEKAIQLHYDLKEQIYTDYKSKLDLYRSQINTINERIKNEKEGERTSAQEGCGDECNKLKNKKEELEDKLEIKDIEFFIDKIAPNFEIKKEELEKKPPGKIHRGDEEAISELPPKFQSKLIMSNYDRENYFPEISHFILPWIKLIKDNEEEAIAAFLIASSIDGLSLLLGNIKSQSMFFRDNTIHLVSLLVGFKRSITTLIIALKEVSKPYQYQGREISKHEDEELKKFSTIADSKDVDMNNFLNIFHSSIHPSTRRIYGDIIESQLDQESSSLDKNPYKSLYNDLIDSLNHLGWIKINLAKSSKDNKNLTSQKTNLTSQKTNNFLGWGNEIEISIRQNKYEDFHNWYMDQKVRYSTPKETAHLPANNGKVRKKNDNKVE